MRTVQSEIGTYDMRPTYSALLQHLLGKVVQRLRGKATKNRSRIGRRKIHEGQLANDVLIQIVTNSTPSTVSRLGTTENAVVKFYVENQKNGKCNFPQELANAIRELSGFFPPTDELLSQFSRQALEHLRDVDVMGVRSEKGEQAYWSFEDFFITKYATGCKLIDLNALVPLGNPHSWTRQLKDRKVLVIHPFAQTVTQQFAKRRDLFVIPDFLPDCDLEVLPAVQSVGDNSSQTGFATWFDALDSMKKEIARKDFEVALIGAGAYGLFLAAECKRLGKVGIHIGGATQLLFGILGKRWIDPSSPDSASVLPHINEQWAAPSRSEVPSGASKVEGGCYWV